MLAFDHVEPMRGSRLCSGLSFDPRTETKIVPADEVPFDDISEASLILEPEKPASQILAFDPCSILITHGVVVTRFYDSWFVGAH